MKTKLTIIITAVVLLLAPQATAQETNIGNGHVKINVNQTYALENAADAHRDLGARRTTGSTVLLP